MSSECRGSSSFLRIPLTCESTDIAILNDMSIEQVTFLVILAGALYLFVTERLRVDVTAMLTLLALVVTGILDSKKALSGFASEPAIIVAAVFVISAGLTATGITEKIGAWVSRVSGSSETRAIGVIMPTTAVMASFTHHVMVTAMMVPILTKLARVKNLSVSRLLMPMSLAASLGTTLTLVSAPAFLLANDMIERSGAKSLGIFSITPIGIALVLMGTLYFLLMRFFLPKHMGEADDAEYFRLDRYRTELVVGAESRWATRPMADLKAAMGKDFEVIGWLRDDIDRDDLNDKSPLSRGDILIVDASPDNIASLEADKGIHLNAVERFGILAEQGDGKLQLVQAVVAPGSEFIGRSVRELQFAQRNGVLVTGMWRRSGKLQEKRYAEERLQEGDLVVLWGRPSEFSQLASHQGFLMLVPFTGETKRPLHAPIALGILAATVFAAATHLLDAPLAFLLGAVAMVATRCVGIDQAYREIDVRIFVMIAGVIPLGIAMEDTGTAKMISNAMSHLVAQWPTLAILFMLFIAAGLLTQILSDAATTVLLGPIALALATTLGLPVTPFVVVTALGAVASFLTPIGHHGNLLILKPGNYRFKDFLVIGLPLTLMIGLVASWMARWLWLEGPLLPTF